MPSLVSRPPTFSLSEWATHNPTIPTRQDWNPIPLQADYLSIDSCHSRKGSLIMHKASGRVGRVIVGRRRVALEMGPSTGCGRRLRLGLTELAGQA